ncbi:uncharacterized protein C7orf50 homolog isoform X1 [Drosophila albomicans]|uniref:Uncharacterized protein C7orf50 homolog isoform X1 n=1 Tax=Drosophila albomicans TaxID=7291 RepID=A0A6P8Z039_DROAB|nr:uncharacterized protein C7orf50 homolog isoform X1 [Drosophila albomicans]
MARTELEPKKQKRKSKKRKHEATQGSSDDEVANKSLIVDEQPEETQVEPEERVKIGKASKRKQQKQDVTAIKEKRSKQSEETNEDVEGDEVEGPTAEQLEEAAKPENTNAIVTVRQKKKQKHLKRLEEQKDQNADKESKRNEEYLKKWKDNRKEWKFEKLRQISIQQTAFDEQKVSEELWPIALEYLASSKGAAKTMLTKLADDVIQELDKKCEQLEDEAERKIIVESSRYQRARNLLQNFD